MFGSFKKSMMAEFEMSDLGMMHYFLGIEMLQSSIDILISQKKYVGEILDRFQMKDCNYVNTPSEFGLKLNKDDGGKKINSTLYKHILGSLMYLTATRPDIMHAKQPIVTLSTIEAKFVAATACACQAIWVKKILKELQFKEDGLTVIYCDNSLAIKALKESCSTWSKQAYRCEVSFLERSHK
ncbi:uncharacterized mitochondrial protein AtMg00810-like [Malania oleifera]|uniref:uncharacterized mitochondrial protein AtMg00810-like n=1 Tax=Malania oleifera TaxID=397392 RepID=UPI0025AE86F5|nr:uncharacterized mitochondrial protein AtMg00810-like [Malania oleifera]